MATALRRSRSPPVTARRRPHLSADAPQEREAAGGDAGLVDVSLTIPAHNESGNIARVVTSARDVLARGGATWEIVLVDDGSTDGTVDVARAALGDDAQHLRAIRHTQKSGYAVTVCDGLRASRGRTLAFMDGDGQFHARDLAMLLDRRDEADVVAGIRARRADPWYRSFVSGVYNRVVRVAFGIRERDFDCGLKVMSRRFYDAAAPIHARSAVFNPELFFKAHRMGFRVLQVPVRHLPRLAGVRSGGRLIPVMRALRDVVRLRLWLALRWRSPRAVRGSRLWMLTLPGFALFTLLRIPSLFEPHWYTDEASYVSTGRSLVSGHVLYSQIWSNKPPLHLWTVGIVATLFGPSELALHTLTLVSGALTLAAIAWAATRVFGAPRAAVAVLLGALVLGLPILDTELALPDSILIAPLTWAGALLVVRLGAQADAPPARRARWPYVAGALVAAAIAYQQTALAEALAFALVIALSSRATRRDLAAYAGTAVALTAVWLGAAIATAGVNSVAFGLAGFYVAYTQSVLPSSTSGALWHVGQTVAAVALVAAGAVAQRRSAGAWWLVLVWLGASLSVPALANQPYAHYLAAVAAPAVLALAGVPLPRRSWFRRPALPTGARVLPSLAGLGVLAAMASVAGLDWVPAASANPILNETRTLAQYYGGALHALDSDLRQEWDDDFDDRVQADQAVAAWIREKGLSGATAVVWSSDTWLYSLADLPVLMPTPPIYNDEVLLGINGEVEQYVAALAPQLIIVSSVEHQEFPEIDKLLDGGGYEPEFASGPDLVWVRSDVATQMT